MRNTTNWQNHTCNKIDLLVILTHLKASWPSFITGSFCCFPPIIIKYIFLIRLIFWNTETAKTSLYRSVMHITSLIPLKKKERKKISKRLSTKTFFSFVHIWKKQQVQLRSVCFALLTYNQAATTVILKSPSFEWYKTIPCEPHKKATTFFSQTFLKA